jgi:amino-acid N-acetyltransferase
MLGRDLNPVIAVDYGRSGGKGVCRYRTQTLPELYKMGVDEPTRGGSLLSTTDAGTASGGVNAASPVRDRSLIVVETARASDATDIHEVVSFFADRDEMLHRPLNEVYENLRDFYIARVDGQFAGCVALHLWWADLAEVKSLAVREDRQLKGIGFKLVSACLDEARQLGLAQVFALTYKPAFFEKLGFKIADVSEFPRKVWNECYRCPKFANCNEIAVALDLRESGIAPNHQPRP